jgi:hypothetical protein
MLYTVEEFSFSNAALPTAYVVESREDNNN